MLWKTKYHVVSLTLYYPLQKIGHAVLCKLECVMLVAMCNVQHIVTNHTEIQISQERRAALPSPFTGRWLHMCSFKKCITHSAGNSAIENLCIIIIIIIAEKNVHMETVVSLYLTVTKKLLIYHFHQETSSIVHLVEIVMYDISLTSFVFCVKKA